MRLDGSETEKATRGRGKKFMLSGKPRDNGSGFDLNCRLVSRGDGWHTRQERSVNASGNTMIERHVLVRPEEDDIAVTRYFRRTKEDIPPPS